MYCILYIEKKTKYRYFDKLIFNVLRIMLSRLEFTNYKTQLSPNLLTVNVENLINTNAGIEIIHHYSNALFNYKLILPYIASLYSIF